MIKIKDYIIQIFDFNWFVKLGRKTQIEIGLGTLAVLFAGVVLIYSLNKKVHDLPDILKSGRDRKSVV